MCCYGVTVAAGKSTLIGALLRLVDITGGQLVVDGLDICSVGLHELRPHISVIPQTPFLFSGGWAGAQVA